MTEIPKKYNIDNAKNDIQNLQDQNKYDFQEIKRLERLIKEYDERVLQVINFNSQLNKKIQSQISSLLDKIKNLEGNSPSSGGSGLTTSQTNQLNTAYNHSLSPHVKTSNIPTKTSQLINNSGFITNIPAEYITETELTAKGYLTSHQDISNLQNKTDNALNTNNKTIIGAINELFALIKNIENGSSGLGDEYETSCTSAYILDKMYPMGQSHEAIPSGLITDTWKYETRWENQNRPTALPHNCNQSGCPGTGLFSALGCWSNVYRVEDTPFTQNTGVEMKDIKVYGWYNGKWELVQYLPVPNGNFYAESFGGDASKYFADSIKETATSKTIILREKNKIDAMNWSTGQLQTENCMYHPFSDVKYFDTKYEYIYTCIDLRKVKWNENGIDDRDSTHYCSNCGGDWWLTEGLTFHDSWQHNKGICQPKMIEITNEWRRFSMTTVPETWSNGFPK